MNEMNLMVFVCDTVLGCLLSIMMHRYTAVWASRIPALELLARIGDYEARPCVLSGQRPPSTTRTERHRSQCMACHTHPADRQGRARHESYRPQLHDGGGRRGRVEVRTQETHPGRRH